MPTTVDLTAALTALGGDDPVRSGRVEVTYWAAGGPFVDVTGPQVTFSPPISVRVIDGAPEAPLQLASTGGDRCVRWDVYDHVSGRALLGVFTAIPDVEAVAFGDLPRVDPSTFEPVESSPSLLELIVQVVRGEFDVSVFQIDGGTAATIHEGAEA